MGRVCDVHRRHTHPSLPRPITSALGPTRRGAHAPTPPPIANPPLQASAEDLALGPFPFPPSSVFPPPLSHPSPTYVCFETREREWGLIPFLSMSNSPPRTLAHDRQLSPLCPPLFPPTHSSMFVPLPQPPPPHTGSRCGWTPHCGFARSSEDRQERKAPSPTTSQATHSTLQHPRPTSVVRRA